MANPVKVVQLLDPVWERLRRERDEIEHRLLTRGAFVFDPEERARLERRRDYVRRAMDLLRQAADPISALDLDV